MYSPYNISEAHFLKAPVGKIVFSPIPNLSNTDALWLQVGLAAIQKGQYLMSREWDSTVINHRITTLVQPLLKRCHVLSPLIFTILNPFLSLLNDNE